MSELLCPLLQKSCIREECAWYAGGIQKCVVVALGVMTNQMHDMGVQAFQTYVEQEPIGT